MKRFLSLCIIFSGLMQAAYSQGFNYDESKVRSYTLEDPLTFVSGRKVRSIADWEERRTEILDIFQSEMYGRFPESSEVFLETVDEGVTLSGFGIRRQVRMWFRSDMTGPSVDWLIVLPRYASGKVPAIISLNYQGNHTILADSEVPLPDCYLRNNAAAFVTYHHASELSRGLYSVPGGDTVYPLDMILARGYAFVTACYGEVSPDPTKYEDQLELPYSSGVFELWGPRDNSRDDNTTALAAWAWALCRGMDMLEAQKEIDASRVVLTGYSRLAKAALLAGAYDERFAVVVPVQTGGGGVPLARRNFGETIASEVNAFKHWFCRAYAKYADNEDSLYFDQHLLVSCVAPRALLVEGFDAGWFDTRGEFLSVLAASPVWDKFRDGGLPTSQWPDEYDTSAIGAYLGYVRRSERHGISAYDWTWMMNFADGVWQADR